MDFSFVVCVEGRVEVVGGGEPAFGGEGFGRGEVEGMVVGCVVGDADFDLRGEGGSVNGLEEGEGAYIRGDEVAADCCARGRGDSSDAFGDCREHSHAFFQAGG